MASRLNEDLLKTNLDIPEGEIKIEGKVNPVYADAINVHNKKKKDIEKVLKDKKPELKKPFLGTKGNTTIMPKTKEMKKLKLSEDMFRNVKHLNENFNDCPEIYEEIFRVISNMEHIINYINDLGEDEDFTYQDMQQSYDVLEEAMDEFKGYLEEIQKAERTKKPVKEAVMDRPQTRDDWLKIDKKNNKDIWSDIYNELVDIKDLEAPHRQMKAGKGQRFKGSWDFANEVRVGVSPIDDAIVVKADDESKLDFAKEVAETYGVKYKVKEHTSRYADSKFEIKIYPYEKVTNEDIKIGVNKKDSIKESYTKVDTIECGTDTYRVLGGGFNPTADALVTVEDEHGEKTRLHIGDVIEFYTWYDKNGNVVHEPSSVDESLNEDTVTLDDNDKKALKHLQDYRNKKTDMEQLHKNVEQVYGNKTQAVPRLSELDQLSDADIKKALGESVEDEDVDETVYIHKQSKDKYTMAPTNDGRVRLYKHADDSGKSDITISKDEFEKNYIKEDLRIYRDSDLSDFEFWAGAKDTVKYLTDAEVRTIGRYLEDVFPDGCTETDINDFFWFEDDTIAEWLGYNSFEEIMDRDSEE